MKRSGLFLLGCLALAGCSSQHDEVPELRVMAAASMCQVAEYIAETIHDLDITVVCGGSADLVAQLDAGAPADILITANEQTAELAVDSGEATLVSTIASNELILVTPADNPAHITGFDESLANTQLVTCAPQVPCGKATADVAAANGLTLHPVSEEQSVTDVLGKVTSGQADAGIVYRTDGIRAGTSVTTFDIPHAAEYPNKYLLLLVGTSSPSDTQEKWIDALSSQSGQAAMRDAGFEVAQ